MASEIRTESIPHSWHPARREKEGKLRRRHGGQEKNHQKGEKQ